MTTTPPLTRKQLRELQSAPQAPLHLGGMPSAHASHVAPAAPMSRREARRREQMRAGDFAWSPPPATFAPPPSSYGVAAPASPAVPPGSAVHAYESALESLRRSRAAGEDAQMSAPISAFAHLREQEYRDPWLRSDPAVAAQAAEVAVRPVAPPPAVAPSHDMTSHMDATGSQQFTSTALIFNRGPEPLLSGPINATGELLVTGVVELPVGLGSKGHALGTTDGRESDAGLFDEELAMHSSPAPVAASAAISTAKTTRGVMRQPAPEKVGGLPMALALTAGGLMITLSVVIIMAFVNGLF